jgi:hypothetical protein
MLLWILLLTALMLMAAFAWLVASMGRAERRARRSLYRGLGLAEATVDFLMERNRDVLTELSYVRQEEVAASEVLPAATPRPSAVGGMRPNLRLVEPPSDVGLLPGERPPAPDERPRQH